MKNLVNYLGPRRLAQFAVSAVAGTSIANAVIMICVLASGILVARLLGPEERGLLAAMMLWPGLLTSLGAFGLHQSVVVLMTRPQPDISAPELLVMAHSIGIVVAASTALLFFSVAPLFPEVRAPPLYVFCSIVAASIAGNALNSLHHARGRYTLYNTIRVQQSVLYALVALFLYYLNLQSVDLLMAGYAATLLIPAVFCTFSISLKPKWPTLAQYTLLLRTGILFQVPALLAIAMAYTDRVLVATLYASDIVGHYFVAYAWTGAAVVAAAQPVQIVLFQKVAKNITGRPPLLAAMRASGILGVAVALVSAVSIALAPTLIPLFFGNEFIFAATIAASLQAAAALVFFRSALIELSILTPLRGQQYLSDGVTIAVFLTGLAMYYPLDDIFDLIRLQIAAQTTGIAALIGFVAWRWARATGASGLRGKEDAAAT